LLPRIFDKFFRAPNAPAGGSGLGLAIVKGFVEAHGGRFPRPTVPAAAQSSPSKFRKPNYHPSGKIVMNQTSKKTSTIVLVIDDEPQIRRLLRVTLEANGYKVLTPKPEMTASCRPRNAGRM
jgi:hypothetical protein